MKLGKAGKTLLAALSMAMMLTAVSPAEAQVATPAETTAAVRFADTVISSQNAKVSKKVVKGKGKKAKAKRKAAEKKYEKARKAALTKLFKYMSSSRFGYTRADNESRTGNWYIPYAVRMMQTKSGSCYHYAAAFAVLAKRATNYPVRVCIGKADVFRKKRFSRHAWVEIKIGKKWYTFDPNAARFSTRKMKWSFMKASRAKKDYKNAVRYTVSLQ